MHTVRATACSPTRNPPPRCMRNCPRAQHAHPALQAQLPARPRELPPPHAATPILRNCLHRTHAVHLVFRHTHARRRVALVAGALLLSLKAVCIHSSQCCGVYGVAGGSGEGSRASGVACPVGDVVQLIRSGEGREGDGSRGSTTAKRCLCGHGFGRAPAFLVEGDDADVETHGDLWWVASIRTETRGGSAMVRMLMFLQNRLATKVEKSRKQMKKRKNRTKKIKGEEEQGDEDPLGEEENDRLKAILGEWSSRATKLARALEAERMSSVELRKNIAKLFHNASTAKGVSWDN
ncbi:hypothetical protein GUJ93_ZPchr0003g16960 [Zizania palustris]|uniref:Uncharacterized protein n=1 Tax=Zizania palustris TaxID=103762 RepID=A0A8J5SSA4_ZIZPA|nr:hypothetical protein GUJ93_ZPchr0003g16960 [Zizania palustris]